MLGLEAAAQPPAANSGVHAAWLAHMAWQWQHSQAPDQCDAGSIQPAALLPTVAAGPRRARRMARADTGPGREATAAVRWAALMVPTPPLT